MSVQVTIPDDLAERIDDVAADRTAFVTEAVRRLLRESSQPTIDDEVARINEVADELNREAEDVLEYQVIA
jgi:metal-responsive CopG/Arc/MetJ family transcriptional regulator